MARWFKEVNIIYHGLSDLFSSSMNAYSNHEKQIVELSIISSVRHNELEAWMIEAEAALIHGFQMADMPITLKQTTNIMQAVTELARTRALYGERVNKALFLEIVSLLVKVATVR